MTIRSATQVVLASGVQRLTFQTTTAPTTAVFTWEKGGRASVRTSYNSASQSYIAEYLVPAEEFRVKLNTEAKTMLFSSQWGDDKANNIIAAEYDGQTISIPYCDLETVDLKFYNNVMQPLEVWGDYLRGRKAWNLNSVSVENLYGGSTLIARLQVEIFAKTRVQGSANWVNLNELEGGYVIDVVNHTRVTTDRIVNATICRGDLYGKTYRARWGT